MITLAVLDHGAGVRHAFFTRQGGVSGGLYESLNCGFGSGDATESVARNRDRNEQLDLRLTAGYLPSIHSTTVVIVERTGLRGRALADGMARVPDIAPGVLTADCALICSRIPLPTSSGRHMAVGAALSAAWSRPRSSRWR